MDSPSRHKHRLEPDPFRANIALSANFGALSNIANGPHILFFESIFIAIYDDTVVVDLERNVRLVALLPSSSIVVILGIL
jgi:hypothetical protein